MYRVPIHIDVGAGAGARARATATVSLSAGYSDWTGQDGAINFVLKDGRRKMTNVCSSRSR